MEIDQQREPHAEVLQRTAGSFEMVLSPVVLAFAGFWVDNALGIVPVFTVALATLGFVGAVVKQYYDYRRQMARDDAGRRAALERRGAEGTRRHAGGSEVAA